MILLILFICYEVMPVCEYFYFGLLPQTAAKKLHKINYYVQYNIVIPYNALGLLMINFDHQYSAVQNPKS